MPKGPQGQKRPQSTTSAAVQVCRIATGQIQEPSGNCRVINLSKVRKGEATDRKNGR